jgi:hypothetical protein
MVDIVEYGIANKNMNLRPGPFDRSKRRVAKQQNVQVRRPGSDTNNDRGTGIISSPVMVNVVLISTRRGTFSSGRLRSSLQRDESGEPLSANQNGGTILHVGSFERFRVV